MMSLRRAAERHHVRRRKQHVWLTFYAEDQTDSLAGGFGAIKSFNEYHLPPGAAVPFQPHDDTEIITYVSAGGLKHKDSMGHSSFIQAGEFQRITTGCGERHISTNPSRVNEAHVFQIWLPPQIWLYTSEADFEPTYEQKRFSTAQRRDILCVIASPDRRKGSLRVQSALIYSALLEQGRHLIHELSARQSAWLHVVKGDLTLDNVVLTAGDSAGITAQQAVSFTARTESEILLVELGESGSHTS